MKLLVDMNLSPRWADVLTNEGIEAAHWSTLAACRTLGVEAKFAKTEDSFFRIRSPIAQLWGKKAGKNGPVSRKLQPTIQSPTGC